MVELDQWYEDFCTRKGITFDGLTPEQIQEIEKVFESNEILVVCSIKDGDEVITKIELDYSKPDQVHLEMWKAIVEMAIRKEEKDLESRSYNLFSRSKRFVRSIYDRIVGRRG